ncbi:hypothetical protein [Pseudomonas farris]
MSAEILDLADHRPHLTIVADNGIHVMPVALVREVIAGEKPSSILTESVLRRIIAEWIERVTA